MTRASKSLRIPFVVRIVPTQFEFRTHSAFHKGKNVLAKVVQILAVVAGLLPSGFQIEGE